MHHKFGLATTAFILFVAIHTTNARQKTCGWDTNCNYKGRSANKLVEVPFPRNAYLHEYLERKSLKSDSNGMKGRGFVYDSQAPVPVFHGKIKGKNRTAAAAGLVVTAGGATVGEKGQIAGGATIGPVAAGDPVTIKLPSIGTIAVGGIISGLPGRLVDVAVQIGGTAAEVVAKIKALPCKSLSGPSNGEVETSNVGGTKMMKKVTTENLNDVGLPGTIIKEISEIIESMETQDYNYNNNSYTSKLSIIDYENEVQDPTIPVSNSKPALLNKAVSVDVSYDKKLAGFPECLPRVPNPHLSRSKRAVKRKNCRPKFVPPPAKPFCDDYFKEHPDQLNVKPELKLKELEEAAASADPKAVKPNSTKVVFKIQVLQEQKNEYFFKVSNTEVSKSEIRTTIYEEGDVFLIKMKKKKPAEEGKPSPPQFSFPIFKMTAKDTKDSDDQKTVEDLEKKMDFENLVTVIWTQVDLKTFCVKDVFLTPLTNASNLCGDLPFFFNFLQQVEADAAKTKTTALFLEYDSSPYKKLFTPGSIFSFAAWYRVFQNAIIGGNFQGHSFKVKDDWNEGNGHHRGVQNITIVWGPNKNIAKIDISYPLNASPVVYRQDLKPDGKTANPVCKQLRSVEPVTYALGANSKGTSRK